MDENAFDKLKSMFNNSNIPDDLKNIMSNINSSNKTNSSDKQSNSISPETISNLMNMLNSNKQNNIKDSTDSEDTTGSSADNFNIDFETIMKFKTIMDKMNSKDDPRSKLLISLKPYLKDSRKNKVDQYIQFFNMSKIIDAFSNSNGDGKLWI